MIQSNQIEESIMKNRNIKFIFFGILLLISVFLADNIFAAPSKRATKSKSTSSRKKNKTTVANTASTENLDDERAGSTTARARGTISTTTTSTTAVDDDTAAELLASNLLACINSACYGDVPYEKCFKTGVAETYIRANSECLSMYNGAKSDLIRIKAKNLITTKIKSYFADSCSSAGGKVSGDVCKVQICYFAKGGDKKQKRCQDFNVGKSFTCSYQAFGLTDKDMEYQEEMTGEQMGMIVNAGINAFTGLLQTGMSVADTVMASKELKKKNILKGKDCAFVYSYGADHLEVSDNYCDYSELEMCENQGKKECKDTNGKNVDVTDDQGRHYKGYNKKQDTSTPAEVVSSKDIGKDQAKVNGNNPVSCQSLTAGKWVKDGDGSTTYNKCYVEFSEWTDLAVKEKEAELYKKFTDFKTLQFKDNVGAAYLQAEYTNAMGVNLGNNNKKYCSFGVEITGRLSGSYEAVCKQHAPTECSPSSPKLDTCTSAYSTYDSSTTNSKIIVNCSCEVDNGDSTNTSTTSKQLLNAYNNGYFGENNNGNAIVINNYSSAVETYNSMQKSVSEEKKKITALEEKKQSGLSNAIASGASTLVQSGGALTTAIVAAKSNTATMTGACYIGDPENGGSLFANEGAAKKLTWSNL